MRKALLIGLALLLTVGATAGKKLEIKDLTSSKFTAASIGSVRPLADGETYARMGEGSKRIEVCSFKTGKQIGVLLDVDDVKGGQLDRVDGYMVSPDGSYVLCRPIRSASIAILIPPPIIYIGCPTTN
jgi:dipeptidyl-peptidase-4